MNDKKEKKVLFFPAVYGGGAMSIADYCRIIFIELWFPKDGWYV